MKVYVLDAEYRRAREAVDRIFRSLAPNLRGRTVLVKPNSISEREPEMGANVHPALLRAVLEAVRDEGPARIMVGDNPGQADYGRSRRVFAANGLGAVAGATLVNLGLDLVPRRVPALGVDLYFPRLLFEADCVISLPKLKVHPWTGLTAGVKNTFGYLAGAQKSRCHVLAASLEQFEEALRDIHLLRPPDLTILDAILMLEAKTQGLASLRYLGKVVASTEAAAVDVVAAAMIDLEPGSLHHVTGVARARGVPLDIASLEVEGSFAPVTDIRQAQGYGNQGPPRPWVMSESLRALAYRTVAEVDEEKCDGCGECARHCPARTLRLRDGRPSVVDAARCTSCLACIEACDRNALDLRSEASQESRASRPALPGDREIASRGESE